MPDNMRQLVQRLIDGGVDVDDTLETAAVLESWGITDSVAMSTYGSTDVFNLANSLFDVLQRERASLRMRVVEDAAGQEEHEHFITKAGDTLRHLIRGGLFVMPILISVASIVSLRFSLWAYMDFGLEEATAIAIGTILSFLVTGGYTQALGRRGLMYLIQNEFGMARKFVFLTLRVGIITSTIVGIILFIFHLIVPLLPWHMLVMTIEYYAFMCLIWLSIAALYMMQQEFLFTLFVACGIGIVFICFKLLGLHIVTSQLLGLSFTAIASLFASVNILKAREARTEKSYKVTALPRLSVLGYTLIPYFTYGLLYFGLLYTDRVMAWSANRGAIKPILWFEGHYELGMDWASFALLLPMGILEVYINRFARSLVRETKSEKLHAIDEFNKRHMSRYFKQVAVMSVFAIMFGLFIWWVLHLDQHTFEMLTNKVILPPILSDVTEFVLRWAIVGYVMICIGLMNCLHFACLSHHKPILRAVAMGFALNVFVGFILSRTVDYYYAVIGMVVGAFAFAAYSTLSAVSFFKNLPYHQYTSM